VVPGHRAAGLTLDSDKNFPAALVLFRRGHTDIDRRQNGEDIRLNDRNKDVQADESQRQDSGKHAQDDAQHGSLGPTPEGRSGEQAEKDAVNHIASENVGPKTDGEREQSRRGADNFHGENQRRKPPDRSGKVLEVSADAMMADALPIEIEKSEDGASQGNADISSRRGKERKSSEEVAEKHENRNRADKGNVLRSVMTGVFFEQITNADAERIGEKHLGDLLAGTGLFNRQSGTEKERDERSYHEDDQSHHDVLGNRHLGIVGYDVQRVKQGQDQRPWATGLAIGTVLAWLNFRWLKRGLDALVRASEAQQGRERPKVPLATYFTAIFRYGLLVLAVYVIFNYLHVPIGSMVVGLCALAAATIAASVWEILHPVE